MGKKSALLVMLLFCCLVFIRYKPVFADEKTCENDLIISEQYYFDGYLGYKYHVLPKMSTWPYGNHKKMIEVCSVPDTELVEMSTEELLETVLAYPLLDDALYYNSPQEGYQVIKSYYRPLQELIKREDRSDCLINFIRNIQTQIVNKWSKAEYDEKVKVEVESLKHFLKMAFLLEGLPDFPDVSEAFIVKDSDELRVEDKSINATPLYPIEYSVILKTQTTVYTPKNAPMGAYEYTVAEKWLYSDFSYRNRYFDDFSDEMKSDYESDISDIYGIYPISGADASIKYNCHSYAWYQQLSPFYWVNLYNSTGYSSVGMQAANIGGIIVYFKSTGNNIQFPLEYSHSAKIISKIYGSSTVVSFNLRSKWGPAGLYNHTMENCPYYYYPEGTYNVADRMYYNP